MKLHASKAMEEPYVACNAPVLTPALNALASFTCCYFPCSASHSPPRHQV